MLCGQSEMVKGTAEPHVESHEDTGHDCMAERIMETGIASAGVVVAVAAAAHQQPPRPPPNQQTSLCVLTFSSSLLCALLVLY